MENKNIIRFEFAKKGGLKYISHLDLQRAIVRIIKRSSIPIRYTQGFNPHPKMVFALTLSVGCESECELLDVYMTMDESRPNVPLYTPEEFKEAILPNLPEGLDFINAYYPSRPFTDIKNAIYEIAVDLKNEVDVTDLLSSLLSQPLFVLKKSKAGYKVIDIKPLIRDYDVKQKENQLTLTLTLSAAQNEYLNPELVITALKKEEAVLNSFDYYTITRKKILF